jgi:hypothetical protein
MRIASRAARLAKTQEARYAQDAEGEDRPLGSYLLTTSVYGALVTALAGAVHASGRSLPERLDLTDVALTAVATHKLSRLVTKAPVTSWLRAPFTRFAGQSGPSELAEHVRGEGTRHAVGELLTCPFCLGQWVATGLVFGLVLAPRPTRLVISLFTALSAADFLQFAYAFAQQRAEP